MTIARPVEQRFWEKVDQSGDCWIWTGRLNEDGYGTIRTNGKNQKVHRVSFEMACGAIPPGKEIDHLCRNRSCVNPAHLEAVDHRTNVLRGESLAARQARRTHCQHGHPLTPENLLPSALKFGRRTCIICNRDYKRVLRARKRQHYCVDRLMDAWLADARA